MDVLLKMYAEVSNYDRHYSTVRTTISTFLVAVSFSLGSFLLKEGLEILSLALPTSLLLVTILLNSHYQRLTYSCRRIEQELENELERVMTSPASVSPAVIKFRHNLENAFRGTKVYFDAPMWALVVITIFYLLPVLYVVLK